MEHKSISIENNPNFQGDFPWSLFNFMNNPGNYQNIDNYQLNQLNLLIPFYHHYIINSLFQRNNAQIPDFSSPDINSNYNNFLSNCQSDQLASNYVSNTKVESPNSIYNLMESKQEPIIDINLGSNSNIENNVDRHSFKIENSSNLPDLSSLNREISTNRHFDEVIYQNSPIDSNNTNMSIFNIANSTSNHNESGTCVGNETVTDPTGLITTVSNPINPGHAHKNTDFEVIDDNMKKDNLWVDKISGYSSIPDNVLSITNNYNNTTRFTCNILKNDTIKDNFLDDKKINSGNFNILSIAIKNDDNTKKNDLIVRKYGNNSDSHSQVRREIRSISRAGISSRTKSKFNVNINFNGKHYLNKAIIDTANINNTDVAMNGSHYVNDPDNNDDNSTKRYKCRRCYKHGLIALVRHHICPYKVYSKSDIHNLLFRKDRENGIYKRNIKLKRATVASGKLSKYCCKRCPGVLKKGHKCPYKLC